MKSAAEITLEIIDKKKKEEEEANRLIKYYKDLLETKRQSLYDEITNTCNSFSIFSNVKIENHTIIINNCRRIKIYLELCYSENLDDEPYNNRQYYLIRWKMNDHKTQSYGGHSEIEDFRQGFAQFISQYLF